MAQVDTVLLLSLVPSVALLLCAWLVVKFRNWVVATFVFFVGLLLVVYGIVSLVVASTELHSTLLKGQRPLLAIWAVVHFVILVVMSIRLIYKAV